MNHLLMHARNMAQKNILFEKDDFGTLLMWDSEILVENKLKDQKKYYGRTKNMTPVILESEICNPGDLVSLKITSINKKYLFGAHKLDKERAA